MQKTHEDPMELNWFEDFLELVATRNFSSAAAARRLSQPAFSRRIRSLEGWLGVELVDRSTSPVRLTSAGRSFLPRCTEAVREIYRLRTECQQSSLPDQRHLSFAALHTIAIYFFPDWIAGLAPPGGRWQASMHTADFLESIEHLSLGKCDFAITWDRPDGPPVLQAGPFESLQVGRDRLILVSGIRDGRPIYSLDGDRLPYLAYSWNDGYLGKLVAMVQEKRDRPVPLSTVYQSSLAEGIKHMAIAGQGIAWLPQSCALTAIARGELADIGGPESSMEMEIRIFRKLGHRSRDCEYFWSLLAERSRQQNSAADLALAAR